MKSSVWGPRVYRAPLEAAARPDPGVPWVHPGVSPLAENVELARQCEREGVLFLGSPPRSLAFVRNRVALLHEAERVGLRLAYLSIDPLRSLREVSRVLEVSRGPLRLRALTSDPERRDSYFLRSREDLNSDLVLWLDERIERDPESIVLAARPYDGMRRVLLPLARFIGGATHFFTPLESSLDLRGVSLLQALAASWLGPRILGELQESAYRLAERIHFVGVGAAEFWVDGDRGYFANWVSGLTPGYDLWEAEHATSAWAWAYAIAQGSQSSPSWKSVAAGRQRLQLSLRSEDAFRGLPRVGQLGGVVAGPGWRFNANPVESSQWTSSDDSLVATLTVSAGTWAGALEAAAAELRVFSHQGSLQTNEGYLLQIVAHPWVREGIFHAAFLDEEFVPEVMPPLEVTWVALEKARSLRPHFSHWRVGDRIFAKHERGGMGIPGLKPTVHVVRESGQRLRLKVGEWYLEAVPWQERASTPGSSGPELLSPCDGRVHALWLREGASADAKQQLLVLASQRRLVGVALSQPLRMRRWLVQTGDLVTEGQALAEVTIGS